MFRVGDKVTCVCYGKGEVIEVASSMTFPVRVQLQSARLMTYTEDGRLYADQVMPCLFQGHGTIKVELVSEPVYEWQWLKKHIPSGRFRTTDYYVSEDVARSAVEDDMDWKLMYRIEESKREAKS